MSDVFSGKVVVVTGANGNVGQAVVRRFAADGAKVVLVGRSEAELRALADESGGLAVSADVTDPESIEAMIRQVDAAYGTIDVLAHTVGGYAAGTPVHESGLEVWDKMMTLNARSVFVTGGHVAKYMVERGIKGRIIAILSKNAYKGTAKAAAYSAAKAAAQRVLESMAAELGGKGITVNGIVPTMIDTPQNRADAPNADFSKWIQPDEIANAIAFLAAPSSGAINGVSLDMVGRP